MSSALSLARPSARRLVSAAVPWSRQPYSVRLVSAPVSLSESESKWSTREGKKDLLPGQMAGIKFRVLPNRRVGEDVETTRARLVYQSRKRGILETDLLLSTFASANLDQLSPEQLAQYDLLLDENDWDIYYWATQDETPSPSGAATATSSASSPAEAEQAAEPADAARSSPPAKPSIADAWTLPDGQSEWAQTIGRFKPAYRPVPARWRDSEILAMLRQHVRNRKAGGADIVKKQVERRHLDESQAGKGLGFMPDLPNKL